MHFGVVRETRFQERRVPLAPAACGRLVAAGHTLAVEAGAGAAAGFSDDEYLGAGAQIVWSAQDVALQAEILLKVHAPDDAEDHLVAEGGCVTGLLRLGEASASHRALLRARRVTAISFDLLEEDDGSFPVARAASALAGRVAVALAARHHLCGGGGRGHLFGGCPGVPPLRVVVVGAGAAGSAAAREAARLGASVRVVDRDPRRVARVAEAAPAAEAVLTSGRDIERHLVGADVLIGAVAVPGEPAPRLIARAHLRALRPGAVFVDLAAASGGCAETSRATDPAEPVYEVDGVRHVCLPNVLAEAASDASQVIGNALLPYLLDLGERGLEASVASPGALRRACVFVGGKLRHPGIAAATGEPFDL